MINPKELRLGNIVLIQGSPRVLTKQMFKVAVITLNCQDIEPVPLTEEWLLKHGWQYFNEKTEGVLTMDTPCKLDIDFVDGKMQVKSHYEGFYRDLRIQHVHQLQNFMMDLTGEELVEV
jgi:hypothetical protein